MTSSARLLQLAKPLVERFPRVAATYRLWRDSRFVPEQARMTPLGFKFCGNAAMEQGLHEPEEVQLVRQYLNEVDVFINIGANIGYYCCLALSLGKHTIAFEPIEMNLRYLYTNVQANGWEDHIEVFPLALSNKTGLTYCYGGGTGASLIAGWAGTTKRMRRVVPVSTLDCVLGNRLAGQRCFFLVDIEGAEKFMLEGAVNHLSMKPPPIWMVEISISEHQPAGVAINPHLLATFQIFWQNGYTARTATKDFVEVREEDIVSICQTGRDTLRTHNFLFLPAKPGE